MWKGKGRSGYGESSTLGDYDDWSCLSRNGRQWKNPITMETRDLSGADYWHMRKQLTDSYDVPESMHAVNETVSLAHTLPSGKANLAAYGDPIPVRKTTSKVSIKDKILPQFKRLSVLRSQMLELETSYRSGEMNITDYSLYRDIIVAKIQRQEVLYKRAASVRPKRDEYPEDSTLSYAQSFDNPSDNTQEGEAVGVDWVDELSSENMFKSFLKSACKLCRTAVRWHQKARNYINELKAI